MEVVQVVQYESDTSVEEVVDDSHGIDGNERIKNKKRNGQNGNQRNDGGVSKGRGLGQNQILFRLFPNLF